MRKRLQENAVKKNARKTKVRWQSIVEGGENREDVTCVFSWPAPATVCSWMFGTVLIAVTVCLDFSLSVLTSPFYSETLSSFSTLSSVRFNDGPSKQTLNFSFLAGSLLSPHPPDDKLHLFKCLGTHHARSVFQKHIAEKLRALHRFPDLKKE